MRSLTNDPELLERVITQDARDLAHRPFVRPLTEAAKEALARIAPAELVPLVEDVAKCWIHRLNTDAAVLTPNSYGVASQIKTEEMVFKLLVQPMAERERGAPPTSDADLLAMLEAVGVQVAMPGSA